MTREGAALAAALQLAAARAGAEPLMVRIETRVVPVHARWIESALREAAREKCALVMIVDADGGRLDAAVRVRDALLQAEVPTTCLVTGEALDEAALACLGAARVELAPGARLGGSARTRAAWAAGGREGRRAARLREELLATASARGRSVDAAAALAGGSPGATPALADATDVALPQGRERAMPRPLVLGAWLASPVASGALLALGLLGVLVEVRIPARIAGALGLVALSTFFAAHAIAGLAGWTDAALGALGLVLLAVEIFVLPGFGACGMVGLLFFGSGVLLALAGHDLALALASGTLRTALLVGASASLAAGVALAVVYQVAPPRRPVAHGGRA
jgi:membrane-bound serine protease (ClpP class)